MRTVTLIIAALAIGAVTVAMLGANGSQFEPEADAATAAGCDLKDPSTLKGLVEDPQACFESIVQGAGLEGDFKQVVIAKNGAGFTSITDALPTLAEEEAAETFTDGQGDSFAVEYLRDGDVVYTKTFTADQAAVIHAVFQDTEAEETLRITQGNNVAFEVVY